ncbi:uncharacterized protein [Rhodnius prolixus]|uniref:uncharacterized protein n=1 Tax=Rhodnius prolixus TaxID=13249 RepID=UPI003D189EB0
MHSHIIAVEDGFYTYLYEPTREECIRMVKDRSLRLFSRVIASEINLNRRHRFHVMLAGQINHDDSCEGSTYRFNDKTYHKVIVQAQVEVLLSIQDGVVDLALDEINIPTMHAKCIYGALICLSESAGHIAWEKTSELKSCEEKEYEVIYEGQAHIESKDNGLRIINVSDKKNIFSLVIKEDVRICNQMGFATEHNRLFIVFVNNNHYFFRYKSNNALNVDLIAYINTKIVYVERYIGEKITSLYDDILQQRCMYGTSTISEHPK